MLRAEPLPTLRRDPALDVARGYAMLILLLFMTVPAGLRDLPMTGFVGFVRQQLSHSPWHGLNYIDFGLAGFIQVVGISIVYSLSSRLGRRNGAGLYFKILRRVLILFLLGVLYNGGLRHLWPDVRIAGVLQRIAICYGAGAILFLHLRIAGQVACFVGILVGYWGMLTLIPVPEFGPGNFTFEGNLPAYVDRQWLPGRASLGTWDAEGILTTLPAIATCLGGVLTGEFFRNSQLAPKDKALLSFLAAGVAALVGLTWAEWIPLNKLLWSPSFVMVCQCHLLIVYGAIYLVAEGWKLEKWCFPLVVIGANPLLAYLGIGLLPFRDLADRVVGADLQAAVRPAGPLLVTAVELSLCWLMLYWFYRQRATFKI